jgi:hypothetical protein
MATLESLDTKIDTIVSNLDTKIDAVAFKLDTKIDGLDAKIDNLIEKLDVKFEAIDKKFEAFDHKFEEKIDDLAAMTARGFAEVNDRFEVIEGNYATKDDLLALSKNVDLMLDKHIGAFRKDTNELAKRTKNLEKVVFATS